MLSYLAKLTDTAFNCNIKHTDYRAEFILRLQPLKTHDPPGPTWPSSTSSVFVLVD